MKKLIDRQNRLFEMLEKITDDNLTGEALDQEIKRVRKLVQAEKKEIAKDSKVHNAIKPQTTTDKKPPRKKQGKVKK